MKTTSLILLILSSFIFIGCGKDGEDGKAYLKLNWSYTIVSYYDDNPSIPYSITKNKYYETGAGTFDFSYEIDNGSETRLWVGSYTITRNAGEKGSLLADGKSGSDKYYTLNLRFDGPKVYKAIHSDSTESINSRSVLKKEKVNTFQIKDNKDFQYQIINDSDFRIYLKFKRNN